MSRVLVVEDDVHVREVLLQRLRQHGVEAEAVDNPASALHHLTTAPFDYVLLDLILPRSNGVDLLQEIGALSARPRCIVMSGVADLWRKANPGVEVAGVLQKPFDFKELMKLIRA